MLESLKNYLSLIFHRNENASASDNSPTHSQSSAHNSQHNLLEAISLEEAQNSSEFKLPTFNSSPRRTTVTNAVMPSRTNNHTRTRSLSSPLSPRLPRTSLHQDSSGESFSSKLINTTKKTISRIWNTPHYIYPVLTSTIAVSSIFISNLWQEHFAPENEDQPNNYSFYICLTTLVASTQLLLEKNKRHINHFIEKLTHFPQSFDFFNYELTQGIFEYIIFTPVALRSLFNDNEYQLAKATDVAYLFYFVWVTASQVANNSTQSVTFRRLTDADSYDTSNDQQALINQYRNLHPSRKELYGLLLSSCSFISISVLLDQLGNTDPNSAAAAFTGIMRDIGVATAGFLLGRLFTHFRKSEFGQTMSGVVRRLLIFLLGPTIQVFSLRTDMTPDHDNLYLFLIITGIISSSLYVNYEIEYAINLQTRRGIIKAAEKINTAFPDFYKYLKTLGEIQKNKFDIRNLLFDGLYFTNIMYSYFRYSDYPDFQIALSLSLIGLFPLYRFYNWTNSATQNPAILKLQRALRFTNFNFFLIAPTGIYLGRLYMSYMRFNNIAPQPLAGGMGYIPGVTIPLNTERALVNVTLAYTAASFFVYAVGRSLRHRNNLRLPKSFLTDTLEPFRLIHCNGATPTRTNQPTIKLSHPEAFALYKLLFAAGKLDNSTLLNENFNLPGKIPEFDNLITKKYFFHKHGKIKRLTQLPAITIELIQNYKSLNQSVIDIVTLLETFFIATFLSVRAERISEKFNAHLFFQNPSNGEAGISELNKFHP